MKKNVRELSPVEAGAVSGGANEHGGNGGVAGVVAN